MSYRYIPNKYKPDVPDNRVEDSRRIMKALRDAEIRVSLYDAFYAWDTYSDSMCAGWMRLPETDEEIVTTLSYLVEDSYDWCSY